MRQMGKMAALRKWRHIRLTYHYKITLSEFSKTLLKFKSLCEF